MSRLNQKFLDFRGDVAAVVHVPLEAYRKRPNRLRKTQVNAIPEAKLANARPHIVGRNISSNSMRDHERRTICLTKADAVGTAASCHSAAAVAYLMDNPNGDIEMRSRVVLWD
jgi:hypothetical protein